MGLVLVLAVGFLPYLWYGSFWKPALRDTWLEKIQTSTFFWRILRIYLFSSFLKFCFGLQVLGLTGGIGCGKSTAARMLRKTDKRNLRRTVHVIDLDVLAAEVQRPGQPAFKQISSAFGPKIIDSKGTIDRAKLGQLVFNDNNLRKQLNSIMNKHMLKEICHKIFIAFWRDGAKAVLLDAPLLFESKLSFVCDRTICVISEESIQIERVMKRNPELDAISVKQRIKAQMPLADKAKLADDILDNRRTISEHNLEQQIVKWWNKHSLGQYAGPSRLALILSILLYIGVVLCHSIFEALQYYLYIK